jgi:hypothetical protein
MFQFILILYFGSILSILIFLYRNKLKYFLFSPLASFVFSWFFLFALYSIHDDFMREKTVVVILFFCTVFIFSYFIFDMYKNTFIVGRLSKTYKINLKMKIMLIIFQVIANIAAVYYMYTIISTAGGSISVALLLNGDIDFDPAMLRQTSAIGDFEVPIWAKIMNQFNYFHVINIVLFSRND